VPREPLDQHAVEPSLDLLGVYGQSVSTVIGVLGLCITAGAALVGLYAFVAASGPTDDSLDFGREFTHLLQSAAWTTIDGNVVYWRDVLLVQIEALPFAVRADAQWAREAPR
jgi:hypothetical protein